MSSHESNNEDSLSSCSSHPIKIHFPVPREPSTGLFEWENSPTDSFTSSCSPSSSLLPDISSPSSFDSDCLLSPVDTTFPTSAHATGFTWNTAAAEASAGIHYVLEPFPTPGSTVLGPPFRNEPLKVEGGTRVIVLDEITEHALRVRVVGTGEVGLLPAWDIEGALERLARLNMEFNEAATCPAESKSLHTRNRIVTSGVSSNLTHSHDRCVPFSTRLSFGVHEEEEDEDDEYYEYADDKDSHVVYQFKPQRPTTHPRRKSVEFARIDRHKVFRYPSEALIEAYYGEADEEENNQDTPNTGGDEQGGDDGEWWWAGWEEQRGIN